MGLSDETKKEIDKIFKEWTKPDSPGMAIAVKYQGQVYKKGYGMANLDHNIPITPQTVFHVASVGKQFTAMCIVLLSQEKNEHGNPLISLDDKVRRHIPKLPEKFDSITIRHLLHHTSGIREMLALTSLAGSRWGYDMISRDDLLDLVGRMQTRQFPSAPGHAFAYSNTNFFLAGEVVKELSGMPLAQFAQQKIFGPLGMTSTRIIDNYGETVSNRAQGYRKAGLGFEKKAPKYNFSGPTNLLTTVEDLLKWDANFDTQTVGGKAAIVELLNKTGDAGRGYGLGLFIAGADDPVRVFHNGVTIGHRAMLYRSYNPYPTHELTIAILSNVELDWRIDEREIDALVRKVECAVLDKQIGMADKPLTEIPDAIESHNPMDYVGRYRSNEIDAEYEVKLDGSSLKILRRKRQPVALRPTDKDVFWVNGFDDYLPMLKLVKLTFKRDSGSVSEFFLDSATDPGRFAGFPFRKIK